MLTGWDRVVDELLDAATLDLAVDARPRPSLAAYRGDEPLAFTVLRPFAPGGIVPALVELLALFLPLGADRLALAAPARVWSSDAPAADHVDGVDLRRSAVAVTRVDGHRWATPQLSTSLHPYGRDDHGGFGWLPREDAWADLADGRGPVPAALTSLVRRRDELAADDRRTVVQFARCLLLGHGVVLAPPAAARLELATAAVDG